MVIMTGHSGDIVSTNLQEKFLNSLTLQASGLSGACVKRIYGEKGDSRLMQMCKAGVFFLGSYLRFCWQDML